MSGSLMLLCLAIGLASPGPDALIAGLGSSRYNEREASASAIEKLGRSALPSLRANRQNPDLEVRSRVVALLEKIESSLLLQPTSVALDFQNRPLSEVIAEINRQTGLDLALVPDRDPTWSSRKVTLVAPEPLPFWTAVDRLCDASGLQYSFAGQGRPSDRQTAFALTAGEARPGGPMSDHGPFRVNLMSLHYQKDLTYATTSPGPFPVNPIGKPFVKAAVANPVSRDRLVQEQFHARLQVAAEPSLAISMADAVRTTTALDDRGQSLIDHQESGSIKHMYTYYNSANGAVQFQVLLRYPKQPGKTIKLLRGAIPVQVSTRKPDPLVVTLNTAVGKTFRNDDLALTIHDVKPTANGNPNLKQVSIELSAVAAPSRGREVPPIEADFMIRSAIGLLQVELIDAKGAVVSWFVSGSSQNGEESRTTITVLPGPNGQAATPTTMRYYSTTRTNTEIPFEFRDVPMP